jgi:hypothetical protein
VSGFAVAYPDGVGGCWADGHGVTAADEAGVDDVAFLRALVGTSAERYGTFVARRQVVPRGSAGSGGDNPPSPPAAGTGPREFDAAEEICRFAGPLLAPAQSRRL